MLPIELPLILSPEYLFLVKIALAVFIMAGFIYLAEASSNRRIYGPFLKEEDLDAYFTKYPLKQTYKVDDDLLMADARKNFSLIGLPYIARRNALTWDWHISGCGRIPKRSKWNKVLESFYQESEQGPKGIKKFL